MNDKPTPASHAAAKADAPDAFEALIADHRAVEKLFDAFERATDGDAQTRGALVQRACEELAVHTMVEEELLYPAAREVLPEKEQTQADEAYVEHFLVKTLIAKFETLKPDDQGFNATFKVLTEMVRHHVEEEESEFFPTLRKNGLDARKLGARIAQRRDELNRKLEATGSKLVGDLTFGGSSAGLGTK